MMQAEIEEDPMRVRGSFYMAKSGAGGFGGFGEKAVIKSPRDKKSTSPGGGKFMVPKKKAKLRLEPLKGRNGARVNHQTAVAQGELQGPGQMAGDNIESNVQVSN